ncbi:LytTR family DNA-binding domain-containing protein [Robiginitalea sp. M366]|uniref:LytR/AlgR family response regulator transcription factor n=1 Tax=Robiginitalea aestuariiviva TaxID=3036903 RepID=UPI00240E7CF9|nr:LytTR family DNA-binding domain-containing protein [Robiginitalea aestuariiviva]MDG1573103.1 LytTR family DNA-binding domain-containing protein [Robiginitalea aestuariiviva]
MDYTFGIIDPDAASYLQLQHLLEGFEGFTPVWHEVNPTDGLNSILKGSSDVVFLNLNEGAPDLFELVRELHQFTDTPPVFIGMASDPSHAYQALKHQFFDYWITPYSELEMRKTLMKFGKRFPRTTPAPTLCLQSYKDYQYLNTDEILYLQADNNTTDFIMKDGTRISAFKTLKSFEQKLPANFVRIHQSFILNRNYISRINYGKNRCSLRIGHTELPFSRGYKQNVDALKELLTQASISGRS